MITCRDEANALSPNCRNRECVPAFGTSSLERRFAPSIRRSRKVWHETIAAISQPAPFIERFAECGKLEIVQRGGLQRDWIALCCQNRCFL